MEWINALIQGILLGGLYGLFAVGLSLVFGTMRLVNLAHGDLTLLSAYIGLVIVGSGVARFNPLYSIPIVMVIMFVVGYVLQRGLLNLVVGKGDIQGVIVTFGLSIVIINALQEKFTANSQRLQVGKLEKLSITISDQLAVGWLPLIIFLVGVVVIAALQIFMGRTKMGRAFRAVSDDQEAARLMGVNTKHVWSVAMGVALGICAIGGVLMGIRTTFEPTLGSNLLIFAFEAVIIGGMGSVWGTLLGGVVLGIAQLLGSFAFGPAWAILCGHVVFVVILALRPQGFLAKTVTA
ncbi:MAG: branched-chain amino acid ABC transporter permease [Thermoleophilia bacterium]|nr:branched-chain amino acid ABC transporter permease [Thermoleophilia bacterium]